jgi:hypothetical protein
VGEADPWDYGFNQSKCRSLMCVFIIHTAKPSFCRDGSVKCDQRDHMSHSFAVCNSLPCVFFVSLPCAILRRVFFCFFAVCIFCYCRVILFAVYLLVDIHGKVIFTVFRGV